MALANPTTKDEICKRIHVERGDRKIEGSWVKTHIRITANESADHLAKEEAEKK